MLPSYVGRGSGSTLARSVSMVCDRDIGGSSQLSSVALTMSTVHILTATHRLAPASAADWFNKGRVMCYYVYVIMHVKDP